MLIVISLHFSNKLSVQITSSKLLTLDNNA